MQEYRNYVSTEYGIFDLEYQYEKRFENYSCYEPFSSGQRQKEKSAQCPKLKIWNET